jgi:hypothetical protein
LRSDAMRTMDLYVDVESYIAYGSVFCIIPLGIVTCVYLIKLYNYVLMLGFGEYHTVHIGIIVLYWYSN